MSPETIENDSDPEIVALSSVIRALKSLESSVQVRVLRYAAERLGIGIGIGASVYASDAGRAEESLQLDRRDQEEETGADASTDTNDGISSVALKWMRRSGVTVKELAQFFSVGGEEIDFVAENVPGTNKKERMHNVILLKSIAAYLSGGVARVSYEQVKEACLHYAAFDSTNFAQYLKSFSAEVGGNKESGYTLTPRGLTVATSLLKSLLKSLIPNSGGA